jgi:hypothetical protein
MEDVHTHAHIYPFYHLTTHESLLVLNFNVSQEETWSIL